jgi:pSer/pThr/pTyr-binding forkhead associated (FHA) protein
VLQEGRSRVGRAPDNDIVLADGYASSRHATIVVGPGGAELRDHSKNGTIVDGRKHGGAASPGATVPLSTGARIRVGVTEFELVEATGERTTVAPDDEVTVEQETPIPRPAPRGESRHEESGPYRSVGELASGRMGRPGTRAAARDDDPGPHRPVEEPAGDETVQSRLRFTRRRSSRREPNPEPANVQPDDSSRKVLRLVIAGLIAFVVTTVTMVMITPETRQAAFEILNVSCVTATPNTGEGQTTATNTSGNDDTGQGSYVNITDSWPQVAAQLADLPETARQYLSAGWSHYRDRARPGSGSYQLAAKSWAAAAAELDGANPTLARLARDFAYTARQELDKMVEGGIRQARLKTIQGSHAEARRLAQQLIDELGEPSSRLHGELKKLLDAIEKEKP